MALVQHRSIQRHHSAWRRCRDQGITSCHAPLPHPPRPPQVHVPALLKHSTQTIATAAPDPTHQTAPPSSTREPAPASAAASSASVAWASSAAPPGAVLEDGAAASQAALEGAASPSVAEEAGGLTSPASRGAASPGGGEEAGRLTSLAPELRRAMVVLRLMTLREVEGGVALDVRR